MAYDKTVWKDRVVQRPRTYIESANADGSITHIPSEGSITEVGTPVNASNLNKIENELYSLSTQLNGVVNPWGDNTTSSRSRCEASESNSINLSGSTWTKMLFRQENYDAFNEYDPSTSRFTAKSNGVYLISVSVPMTGVSAQRRVMMDVYRNGTQVWRLQDFSTSIISDMSLVGSTSMYMNAGDYIEIMLCVSGQSSITEPGAALFVTRIA
ncbi:C1q-like domain-containing protein [Paenibacillus sp. FSL H3-0333]|uniref:C1q-like domain-containing protein n=1 Tax=Paenibacillus sp. FSL H3-0333 TaxID=2921373 RepID=UPI0030F91785